ncbi:hypothetical protein BLA29_011719 [Euroglyphus maynei]|uniref:Uncharacterized protein n=1 Tax=Euroglyphus maynei TaxID=6958 RepID=A0A1Y3BY60_EURMA|nr:hypothetical protein BLA29_011719 [Euroglyphus maynei]
MLFILTNNRSKSTFTFSASYLLELNTLWQTYLHPFQNVTLIHHFHPNQIDNVLVFLESKID